MVSGIQARSHHTLDQKTQGRAAGNADECSQDERVCFGVGARSKVSAHHVQAAMRQIDKIHDAEDQRQTGRQHEQQNPQLQAVEDLNKKQ